MNDLVIEGFQYPENPAWSLQPDEIQGMLDRINGARRMWPLLSAMRPFVPLLRDVMCGFVEEQNHRPVGLINYGRQHDTPDWYIFNVTVLPEYRRRGIARRLVEATLDELRRREARSAVLDVVAGNDPAFNLYRELGFEAFAQSGQYHLQPHAAPGAGSPPQGYRFHRLRSLDWRTPYRFARSVTPERVTRYEPVIEARFRSPALMVLAMNLFLALGGSRTERFALYTDHDQVAAVGQYGYRTRSTGMNSAQLAIDPRHPDLAEFMLRHTFSAVSTASPGLRIELAFDDYQTALIEQAEALGCQRRYALDRMGLRLSA